MAKNYYLNRLLASDEFRYQQLAISGIDNGPVLEHFGAHLANEETCLFHRSIPTGDAYLDRAEEVVRNGVERRLPVPVVRFADGEYAFYAESLSCNGLYRQAESAEAIRAALPYHTEMLRRLSREGQLAPLIHPGNCEPPKRPFLPFLRRSQTGSALQFLEFLAENEIDLQGDNYLPFYAIYAYLSSRRFAELLDGRHLCLLNSTWNADACRQWFERHGSAPRLSFVEIPDSYVATRWEAMRPAILEQIPADSDLCLVGAGIGALLVCVDVAERFGIPAIDAGHVLNMMNAREDKSNGLRLYTVWRNTA